MTWPEAIAVVAGCAAPVFTVWALARAAQRASSREAARAFPYHRFPEYMAYAPTCPECGAKPKVLLHEQAQWFQHVCPGCKLASKRASSWKISRYNWDLLVDQRKKKRRKK